jgi:hypothetical protein
MKGYDELFPSNKETDAAVHCLVMLIQIDGKSKERTE